MDRFPADTRMLLSMLLNCGSGTVKYIGTPSKFMICMVIFMLCGQVMAAPFLFCQNMWSAPISDTLQVAEASMPHHCEGMIMVAPAGQDADSSTTDETGAAVNQTFTSMQDCDYLCQFGRCMTSLDASDSLTTLFLLLVRDGDFYTSHILSPPIEVHFRPPINA
jgi:hypothetical protein